MMAILPDPNKCAFLFPGQGSQAVGMGAELASSYPTAGEIFAQGDEILGFPLSKIAWEGPESEINDTINTQPALLVHSAAALCIFQEQFPDYRPAFVAGHSMGELSALFAAEALPFRDALCLVRRRGELMKLAGERSSGGMAAILGLELDVLEEICTHASTEKERVEIANDNCPGQVVISGAREALDRALKLAIEAGARKAVPLAVSIAAHSRLMESVQSDYSQAVTAAPVQEPSIPIVGNVTALPMHTAEDIRADLNAQLNSRVRWTQSIQYMIANGVETFIEIGTGSVLSGLLKRIDRQARSIQLGTPGDIKALSS
jgi:[acyl-carrier-protein] S-malonyltransferase